MESEWSIAETNSIDYIAALARSVGDVLALLGDAWRAYYSSRGASKVYPKVREAKNKVEGDKTMIMEYLTRLGDVMLNARSYLAVVQYLDRVAQLADGAAYRLSLLEKSNITLNDAIGRGIAELLDIAQKQLSLVADALEKLRVNPKKSLANSSEISKLEALADDVYRTTTFELYTGHSGSISALMLGKELLDFVEEICDSLRAAGEELRFLALMKAARG